MKYLAKLLKIVILLFISNIIYSQDTIELPVYHDKTDLFYERVDTIQAVVECENHGIVLTVNPPIYQIKCDTVRWDSIRIHQVYYLTPEGKKITFQWNKWIDTLKTNINNK